MDLLADMRALPKVLSDAINTIEEANKAAQANTEDKGAVSIPTAPPPQTQPSNSEFTVVAFSSYLTKAQEYLPKDIYPYLEELFQPLTGKHTNKAFPEIMASLLDTKIYDPMMDFTEDHEQVFDAFDEGDHLPENLGKLRSFTNQINADPGIKRKELTGKRDDFAITILTNTSKMMKDVQDEEFLRQMKEDSADIYKEFSAETAGLIESRQVELEEQERRHSNLSRELEACKTAAALEKEKIATRKADAAARLQKKRLEAQEQQEAILKLSATLRETVRQGCIAEREFELAEEDEEDLEEDLQQSLTQKEESIAYCEHLMEVSRTELSILDGWKVVLPRAFESICDKLNSRMTDQKEKISEAHCLASDIYLCLVESLRKQEIQYKSGAKMYDAEVKKLNGEILTLENVGEDSVELGEKREQRKNCFSRSEKLKGYVGSNATKKERVEGVRVVLNKDFSAEFGTIETELHNLSKRQYEVVVSRAIDPVSGQEQVSVQRMGIKDVFYTTEERTVLEPWWEKLEEARRQQMLAIQNDNDASDDPQKDILLKLAEDDLALQFDPDRFQFENDDSDSVSLRSFPDGGFDSGQVPPHVA